MNRTALTLGLGLAVLALPATASEQKAHEHGHASLNVAIEDDGIEMELTAPGADIVGFEHQPGSDSDRVAIEEAVATLQQGLFKLPEGAGCELEAVGIYSALLPGGKAIHSGEHHHDEDHKGEHKDEHAHGDHGHGEHGHGEHAHGDHDGGEEHAEFRVHFHYECSDTAAISGFETTYFTAFPNAQELDVAALTPNGQTAAELTAESASVDF